MILEAAVIAVGIVVSFFLKDVNFLALSSVYPDFLLMFLIYFSLRRGEFSGIWIGFFSGLLEDSSILSFSERVGHYVPLIGTHMFFYTLAGFTLGKLNRIIDRRSMVPIVVVVFATTLLVRITIWFSNGILQDFNKNYSFLPVAAYSAMLAPVWFWILSWLYRYTSEEGEGQ